MIRVRRLIWESWNEAHMARHGVVRDEVEFICHHNPLVIRGQQQKRVVVIGYTEEKRLLEVVLQNRGEGRYYPITAHEASNEAKVVYKRERGGEKDETEEK
jgi:uncharacterized DUF497 family protein